MHYKIYLSYNVTQTVQHNNDFLLTLILLPLTVYSLNFHYTLVRSFAFFLCRIEHNLRTHSRHFDLTYLSLTRVGVGTTFIFRALRCMNTAWPMAVVRSLMNVNNKFRIVGNCDNGSINRFNMQTKYDSLK